MRCICHLTKSNSCHGSILYIPNTAKLQIIHRFYKSAVHHRDTNYKTTRLVQTQDETLGKDAQPDMRSNTMQCNILLHVLLLT